MSRGTWNVEIKSSGSWSSDGTLYRPNESYTLPKLSTQSKVVLADGSNVHVTPSTKYLDQPMNFVWYYDDGTTKTKIDTYIDNQSDVKITDDLGNLFIGRFTSITPTRLVGQADEVYDIRSAFEIMPGLATTKTSTNLISRLTVDYADTSTNLVCRLSVYWVDTSKNLVSRLTSRIVTSKALVSRLSVYYIPASKNLVSRLTSLKEVEKNLVSRLTVTYISANTSLVSRITVVAL